MPIGLNPDGRKDSIEITTVMLLDNKLQVEAPNPRPQLLVRFFHQGSWIWHSGHLSDLHYLKL